MSSTNLSAATRRPAGKILARLAARINAGIVLMTLVAVPAFAQVVVAKEAAPATDRKSLLSS